jgi:alcohol dehydrogenase YqhD (iron-dependent ADH family)
MLKLLKGMGKAYKEAQKAKKLDKAARDKLPPEYGGLPRDPEVIKLNKQLKIAKNVGIGTAGAIGGAAVYGKAKRAFKDKDKNND